MLDTISLERKGIPAAVLGLDRLFNTTGRAMARTQGYPSLNFAMFPYSVSEWAGAATEEEVGKRAALLLPQVERILTGEST